MVDTSGKRRRNRPCRLSDSEVMTILVLFHTMHFRDLKSFYLGYVCQHMKKEFPHTVSFDDIHLVTKIKKNMKNSLMNLYDKLMLRKRSVIETVNDELKNVCQIEHTRHRSIDNFATNLFAGLIAYNLLPKKPAMNLEIIDRSRLIA